MSVQAVEAAGPVMLDQDNAARLRLAVHQAVHAARDVLSGSRRLTAEDLEALQAATIRMTAEAYTAEYKPRDNLIDLDAERRRRR